MISRLWPARRFTSGREPAITKGGTRVSQVDTSVQGKQQATTERMKANTGLQPEKQNQSADEKKLEQLCINTIRTLSMDAVQKANSGHPGTPMALAPLAFVLWDRYLRFNPRNPHWAGRDRFILSNGHASMLLYSMLHYRLRPLARRHQAVPPVGIKTPGHPEYGTDARRGNHDRTAGAGCGNSVGMAIAQRWLAAALRQGRSVRLPHLRLLRRRRHDGRRQQRGRFGCRAPRPSNLIWFYDNNHITIEGNTSLAFSDDVATRFLGWHWNVQHVSDVNDLEMLDVAIKVAQKETRARRSLSSTRHIGWGSPHRQDTKEAHGEPLGEEEVRVTKMAYGWPPDAQFLVPDEVKEYMGKAVDRGAAVGAGVGRAVKAWRRRIPIWPRCGSKWSNRELPQGGTRTFRPSRRTRKDRRLASRVRKC